MRRIRTVVLVIAAVCILLILRAFLSPQQTLEPPVVANFPIGDISDLGLDYVPTLYLDIRIRSVSADRKWLALSRPMSYSPLWFFDLEQRRFVAEDAQDVTQMEYACLFDPYWTSQSLAILRSRPHAFRFDGLLKRVWKRDLSDREDLFFYELDVARKQVRILGAYQATRLQLPYNSYDAVANRTRTSVALTTLGSWRGPYRNHVLVQPLGAQHRVAFRVCKPNVPKGHFVRIWSWLDQDASLLLYDHDWLRTRPHPTGRFENLYLMDVPSGRIARTFPVMKEFERLRAEGCLAANEGAIQSARILAVLEPERRVRLSVEFTDGKQPQAGKLSIWDLDLKTGSLERIMDLKGAMPGPVRCSPSGGTFVAISDESPSSTLSPWYTAHLMLYRKNEAPRRLPLEIPVRVPYPPITTAARFGSFLMLDEHTIVATGQGFDIFRYDTRTTEPERLYHKEPYAPPAVNEELFWIEDVCANDQAPSTGSLIVVPSIKSKAKSILRRFTMQAGESANGK